MVESVFRAGAARGDITPDRNLTNYNGAEMEPGREDNRLFCNVLCLSVNNTRVVFIACDLTFIDRSLVLLIRDECRWRFNLNPDGVIITVTHTHNAPAACHTFLAGGKPDPLYIDFLKEKITETVDKALQVMQPALMRSGTAPAPFCAGNRRRLRPDGGITFVDSPEQWTAGLPAEGPVDPYTGFFAVEDTEGNPFAFVITIACHNNCCDTFGGGVYHPDFFGCAGNYLKEKFSSVESVLALPAPSGNILWKSEEEISGAGAEGLARKMGAAYGAAVAEAYHRAAAQSLKEIKQAVEVLVISDRAPEESTVCDDGCRGTSEWELEFARLRYEPETEAVQNRGKTRCLVEVNAVALGNTVFIGNPAELFVEYGLEIRQKSPFPVTLVAELTNGYCGYVPTRGAFERGGYETHRTVYTSRLTVGAGEIITESSLKLLNRLWVNR